MDTGADDVPQFISQLREVLRRESCTLSDVVVTHWHADHLGGLPNVLGTLPDSKLHIQTRLSCRRTLLTLLTFAEHDCRVWKHPGGLERRTAAEHELSELRDGQTLCVEGATLHTHYAPGHSDDHVVLMLEEENALLSGDCVLGEGTAVFEDLHDYMNSLNKILELQPKVIYPGHGNIINDPLDKIRWYIAHREEREQQILDILEVEKNIALTSMEIVKRVYVDTANNLLPAANINVRHHLAKLTKEHKVVHTIDDRWTLRSY